MPSRERRSERDVEDSEEEEENIHVGSEREFAARFMYPQHENYTHANAGMLCFRR